MKVAKEKSEVVIIELAPIPIITKEMIPSNNVSKVLINSL